MDTHRNNFGSVDTFSFHEKNMFSAIELQEGIIIQSILAHSRGMVLNILAVTPSPFIADEAEWNSDMDFGFDSVGLCLVA